MFSVIVMEIGDLCLVVSVFCRLVCSSVMWCRCCSMCCLVMVGWYGCVCSMSGVLRFVFSVWICCVMVDVVMCRCMVVCLKLLVLVMVSSVVVCFGLIVIDMLGVFL